jgi:hypothetical protein
MKKICICFSWRLPLRALRQARSSYQQRQLTPNNAAPNGRQTRGRIGPIGSLTAEDAGTRAKPCSRNRRCIGLECDKSMMVVESPFFQRIITTFSTLKRPFQTIPMASKRVGGRSF